jgi:DNA-binding HxlR family transcriptional regulator
LEYCEVATTLEVVGGRWKAVILFHLMSGTKRFGELRRKLPGATQRMATLQLRELERDGVVSRVVYPQVPPKVEYSLTDFGRSLVPVLIAMRDWGRSHRETLASARRPAEEAA